MAWFNKMCRNVGLMIYNIRQPGTHKHEVKRTTETEQRGNVTLRRTTIEEIEVRGASDEESKHGS